MRKYHLKRPIINGKRSRVWFVTWSENGRSHRRSTGEESQRLAEQWKARFITEMEMPEPGALVADICDAYLKDRTEDGIRDPSTVFYRLKPIKEILGAYEPDDLTRPQVRMYHTARRAAGVSNSTINAECRALRSALHWSFKMRWIDRLPYIEAPKPAKARDRFLTWEEFTRLWDASSPHLQTFLAIAVFTAQRKAAILELTWDDIDWDRAGIWFPQTESTKSRTPWVACNAPLAIQLGKAALLAEGPYVVHWKGKQVKAVKTAFNRAKRISGIEDVTVHDMRRTAASWLVSNGGTFAEAAYLLDDNVETVKRHYARFSEDYSRNVTRRIVG